MRKIEHSRRFDASDRIDVLKVHSVSKAQAMQRAGRAGRDAPGKCYRLYSREEFQKFEAENMPEILRCNLSATFLELMKLGMKNPHKLRLIDPPETKNIDAALLELTSLGAIRPTNADRNKFALTEMGDAFCMYPLPPDHARVLYQAQREGCIMEAIKIISAMQTDAIFSGNGSDSKNEADVERIRRKFETREGDHIGLLKLILTTNAFFDQLNESTQADARF
uniref:RNA helicase n=1 Tax=Caenorhabditis japonica TaxID=281687 RepID=A0A8R1EP69_CAEJA